MFKSVPEHSSSSELERTENDKGEPRKVVWIKFDEFSSPTLNGDVNFSGHTKMNSKSKTQKMLFV